MTSSNGIIFRVTGPLCGEFAGPVEFPTQRPVTRSFDVFFDLRPNKRLSKQPWGWWFEAPSWSLWRHVMFIHHLCGLPVGSSFQSYRSIGTGYQSLFWNIKHGDFWITSFNDGIKTPSCSFCSIISFISIKPTKIQMQLQFNFYFAFMLYALIYDTNNNNNNNNNTKRIIFTRLRVHFLV